MTRWLERTKREKRILFDSENCRCAGDEKDEKDEEEDGVREVVNVKSGAREVNVSGARDIPLSETQRPSLHEGSKLIVQATNATTNQSTAYGTNGSTANRSTISRIGGGDIAAGSNISSDNGRHRHRRRLKNRRRSHVFDSAVTRTPMNRTVCFERLVLTPHRTHHRGGDRGGDRGGGAQGRSSGAGRRGGGRVRGGDPILLFGRSRE